MGQAIVHCVVKNIHAIVNGTGLLPRISDGTLAAIVNDSILQVVVTLALPAALSAVRSRRRCAVSNNVIYSGGGLMLLSDKVCLITGAASLRGIGRATARLFAQHGAKVVILDLDEGQAKAAAADLGQGHFGLACNVTDKDACLKAADGVLDEYGRIDVLINNAGITQAIKLMDIKPEDYDRILDVSLRGTLNMSQAVVPRMRKQRSGSIVCLSSVSAQRGGGIFGGPHYSAAKAGVLGLGKAMARELGPDNVRVNSITPGLIQTDITGDKLTDDLRTEIIKGIPLARLGVADDVGNACLFLASDLSAYITGATIDVNGGMLIH
jgi:NAD(P)-dependent dehydrogenase (short-subunit alcohol dehydrogenase family)